MTKFNASIAAVAATLLLSGQAFAGSLQPAAGEAPFAEAPVVLASSVQRQDVRADAARQLPAAGELSAVAVQAADPSIVVSRAEVRAATIEAIAHGYRVAAGENA
ncbi:MAG: hypothetical protein R3E52_17255 [Burkholderiaceae bacterium]